MLFACDEVAGRSREEVVLVDVDDAEGLLALAVSVRLGRVLRARAVVPDLIRDIFGGSGYLIGVLGYSKMSVLCVRH